MAAHRRRITPSAALRIALILAANVAAGWFLWGLIQRSAQAADAEREAAGTALESSASAALSKVASDARDPEKAAQARMDRLGSRITAIVERSKRKAAAESKGRVDVATTRVAVHVRDPASAAQFGLEAARALQPASNMKLVTTVCALTLLGSDWQFVTPIEARGALEDGRLQGDLVLRASGDPLFDPDSEGSVRALLAAAIDELEQAGLRSVSGNLVLDERDFEEPARVAGWPGPEQRSYEFCSLSGGFSANRGCLTVRVAPSAAGAAADIQVEPAGFALKREFSATTIASGRLSLGFDARVTGLIVRGSIPRNSPPYVGSCPVPDPVELFGEVLRHELRSRGIRIDGATVRQRRTGEGRVLASIRRPLTDYLEAIHQESNNAVADQVFLATAQAFFGSGTRERAHSAALAALERLDAPDADFRQVDGSGLSDLNRISVRQLTALLQAVHAGDPRTAQLYCDSLAVAGVSGTLEGRMRESEAKGRVFAKTGFIDGTSALSGIARCKGGGDLIFSIVVNYEDFSGLNTKVWKPMEDEICELLVGVEP